ncbi:DNA ligase 1 [Hyalella azteca]|uniref:DNA ligase 1 n=1 Tax=Hyalella azteca TaxID=294128 RepID=A0A8B7PJK0_HYAAZ|nr:DNA ligase 1 [Hyalella azteca]
MAKNKINKKAAAATAESPAKPVKESPAPKKSKKKAAAENKSQERKPKQVKEAKPKEVNKAVKRKQPQGETDDKSPAKKAKKEPLKFDFEIFAAKLPKKTDKEAVKKYFSKFGEILQVTVPWNVHKKINRRYCFVAFKNENDFKKALKDTHVIDGATLAVQDAKSRKAAPKEDKAQKNGEKKVKKPKKKEEEEQVDEEEGDEDEEEENDDEDEDDEEEDDE